MSQNEFCLQLYQDFFANKTIGRETAKRNLDVLSQEIQLELARSEFKEVLLVLAAHSNHQEVVLEVLDNPVCQNGLFNDIKKTIYENSFAWREVIDKIRILSTC